MSETTEARPAIWASPGLIVAVLFSLLILLIAVGIVVTNRGSPDPQQTTIAVLRAQPQHYDRQTVILTGTAVRVRQLPLLDQYALYTFQDETGEMWALSQYGAPPEDGSQVRLTAVYHSRVTLDEEIQRIVEAQFGALAASVIGTILPSVEFNAVFLEHQEYERLD